MRFSLVLFAFAVAALLAQPAVAQEVKPPPLPADLPDALLAKHAAGDSYCEPLDELVHGDDWRIYALTEGYVLYMVPCAAGAYNFSHMLYVGWGRSESYSRLLFADYFGLHGWGGVDQLYGAEFDPVTLQLTSFYKLRGIGDCGTAGVWVWDRYAFRMKAFFARHVCEGEPGDFPQVWPPQ